MFWNVKHCSAIFELSIETEYRWNDTQLFIANIVLISYQLLTKNIFLLFCNLFETWKYEIYQKLKTAAHVYHVRTSENLCMSITSFETGQN
jgi:hypothetical protein